MDSKDIAMNAKLDLDADALARFCMLHGILRLALFGSTLKGTAKPGSDVDLLVEFEPGQEPGLMALAEMEAELSVMLRGRSVDLRTPQDLSRYFRDEVLRTAEVQYAGG
jgi:predicted nucleotidyltransferase